MKLKNKPESQKIFEKTVDDIAKASDSTSPYKHIPGLDKKAFRKPSHDEIDALLARAEQAFKIRQYALSEHQRESLKKYGRSLVEEAVAKMDELNAAE